MHLRVCSRTFQTFTVDFAESADTNILYIIIIIILLLYIYIIYSYHVISGMGCLFNCVFDLYYRRVRYGDIKYRSDTQFNRQYILHRAPFYIQPID